MYILKREFGNQKFYTIIDTRAGVDIGRTFNTKEEAKEFIKKGGF